MAFDNRLFGEVHKCIKARITALKNKFVSLRLWTFYDFGPKYYGKIFWSMSRQKHIITKVMFFAVKKFQNILISFREMKMRS